MICSWYAGRWWVGCYIWYSEEGTGRGRSPSRPLIAVPNVTAHPSTASVPITVSLYNDPLLFGFNVLIKGLKWSRFSSVIAWIIALMTTCLDIMWSNQFVYIRLFLTHGCCCLCDHALMKKSVMNVSLHVADQSTDAGKDQQWLLTLPGAPERSSGGLSDEVEPQLFYCSLSGTTRAGTRTLRNTNPMYHLHCPHIPHRHSQHSVPGLPVCV